MARPITWQDVAAPRGIAAAAIAADRAGQSISEALSGFGDVARGVGNDIQKAATGAAVAQIANSQDPTALAAQAPKSWEFDPLAIATAANARSGQLQDIAVKDSTLAANKLAQQVTKGQLEDRETTMKAVEMASPLRAQILAGKGNDLDFSDPLWETAAGREGMKLVDGWMREYNDNKYQQDSLALQRAQAARAARTDAEARALDDTIGKIVEYYGTPKGLGEAPEVRDRTIGEMLKAGGVSLRHIDLARQAATTGLAGNKATDEELSRVDNKTGLSGKQLEQFTMQQDNEAVRGFNMWKSEKAAALRMGQLDKENPYRTTNDADAYEEFIKRHPQVTEGIGKWGAEDFIQRTNTIYKWAKDHKMPIDRAQAMMLVGNTIGRFGVADKDPMLVNSSMAADIRDFHELVKEGGHEQLAEKERQQAAIRDKALAESARKRQVIAATAREGGPLPSDLAREYRSDPAVRKNALTAEISMLRELVGRGDLSNADRQRYSKQLKRQEAALAAL